MALSIDSRELRILAAVLAMPEGDALDALRDIRDQASWLGPCLPELEGLPLEHWQAEHTRLFVSGYPKTVCPPYESVYRQGTMCGTYAADLAALYRRAGLEAAEVPADYLGTMLECAAYLADEGMSDLLDELVDGHLRRWVPRFADDLATHSEIGLYRELGLYIARLFPEAGDDD